jgi:hypothetical protein
MPLDESQLKSEYSEKSVELRRQNSELKSVLQSYRREHGKLEIFFEQVIEAIQPIEPLRHVKFERGSATPVVPVLHLTDLHIGAVQEPNEIEGFNAYSPEIAEARLQDMTARWLRWTDYQRKAYTINDAAIIITGDLISGDIHDELRITNAYPSPVQVAEAARMIAAGIAQIAPYFNSVAIHFISEDNHSRLTKKPQAKEAGLNSMNYLVGKMIEAHIKEHQNVKMSIYPMLEKVIEVNERLYLISHGHNVRGWMGVPWYGVERKVGKEAQSRLHLIMQEVERAREIGFHKYVFGHFHTPIDTTLYSCGASLQGADAYDHQAGRYANPGQSAWLVHPRNGEFNRINFNLK